MMKSLSLLAVLVFSAICMPAPAHAGCDWTSIFNTTMNVWHNYIGADQLEYNFGPINSPSCAAQGALSNLYYYHKSGESQYFWDMNAGTSCTNSAGVKTMHSQTYWNPNGWQYFAGLRCFCSGTNPPGCYWE